MTRISYPEVFEVDTTAHPKGLLERKMNDDEASKLYTPSCLSQEVHDFLRYDKWRGIVVVSERHDVSSTMLALQM